MRRQMHGGAPGGRLRFDGAEAAGLQPAALSKPETVPAQEHHATGGAPDGRPAAPRGRLGRAEENGGAKWHGGCGGFGRLDAARPRVAAGSCTVAGAAPGAAPEPEREGPRHTVDVVGLGAREPREAAARVPGRFVPGLRRERRGRDIQCLRAGQRRHRAGNRGADARGEAPVPRCGLVHIEGAWNLGEQTREPTLPRLADAQRAVAARYGGVVVSFIAGTCYQKTGWFESHPPAAEHQRLAEQIATAWSAIDAARRAHATGFGDGAWTLPQRVYDASAELDSCAVTTELASVEKGEKSFRRVDDASKSLWRYEEDVVGRPGFVAKTTPGAPFDAAAATLRIRLNFSSRQATNTLRVEFLPVHKSKSRRRASLHSVAVPVPRRSTEPARPHRCREMTCTRLTG